MSHPKFNRRQVIQLINRYKSKECLWNSRSKLSKQANLRNKAWQELAAEFNSSAEIVKKKMKSLRTSFVMELKKVKASGTLQNGENAYVPQLFYYNEMVFLNDYILLRDVDNLGESIDCNYDSPRDVKDFFVEIPPLETADPFNELPPSESIERSEPENSNSSLSNGTIDRKYEAAINKDVESTSVEKKDDMFAAFGKSIGAQLTQLPIVTAFRVISEIQTHISQRLIDDLSSDETPKKRIKFH